MNTTQRFDAIVVGAGIPGLFAARELMQANRSVLLLESSVHAELPNYSTAGIPAETLADFSLPVDAVNAAIRHQVVGTSRRRVRKTAHGGRTLAYVLDFGKTKRLMGEACSALGVQVQYGERATSFERTSSGMLLQTPKGQYLATDLIDASGSSSVLMVQDGLRAKHLDSLSIGMEYRIQTRDASLLKFQETIATFFDATLLPHGYGWVFADGPDIFKVGLIEYWVDPARGLPSLEQRLKEFVRFLGVDLQDPRFKLLEKHGGSKVISRHFDRVHHDHLYGIGDSIGGINPFLAEGIRQGLVSAQFAVDAILNQDPKSYTKRWQQFKGPRWKMAELFASLAYRIPDDTFLDTIVEISESLSSEELARLVFQYEFELIFKRAPVASSRALYKKRQEIHEFIRSVDNRS